MQKHISNYMNKEQLYKIPLSRAVLHWLTQRFSWSEAELAQTFDEADIYPSASTSRLWLDRALLVAGVVMLLCGTVFFFAYNWADMHRYAKLALVGAGMVAVGIITVAQSPDSFGFKMGLTGLVGLTGVYFALFGQIYQTGANAYDFFWGWTMVATIWTVISRFPPLWLFYLVLVNATLMLYATQVRLLDVQSGVTLACGAICLAAWVAWEWMHLKGSQLFEARWWPRVVALFAYGLLREIAIEWLFFPFEIHAAWALSSWKWAHTLGIILFLAVSVGIFFVDQKKIKDISMLALLFLAGIVFANALIIKILANSWRDDGALILMFFLCGGGTVTATYFGVQYLIKLHKQWTAAHLDRN